mgnify:CR=1 FL=1
MPERVRWDAERHPTYLARMVHAGWVHRLLSAADGRQMPGPDSGSVSLKCERIIEQLALLGIRYVREPADSERGAQDVRPLNEVLSWRLATCLDMCVTFCCAALDAGVYPMILTLKRGEREHQQRHAIVLVPVKASWSVGCPVRLEEGFTREPFLDDDFRIEDLVTSDPERAQSWLAIDAQQATTPPGGSPGDWAKALAKGAEYLRTWQWDVCVDVGGLRATTMLDDASAPEVRDPSGILLPGYLPLAEGATPLQLLRTRSGVVPFCPRRELNQLRDWACATSGTTENSDNAGIDLAVALVTGAGGCGKTRLAAELCHNLSTLGWCAGFLPARADLSDADLAEFSKLTTELLIVVDYAEESRQEQLRRLLRALAARRSPTRLVLTARGADVWWEQFQENMEEDGVRLGPVLPVRLEQRLDVPGLLYRRAAQAFAKAMDSSLPADPPSPEREGRTTLDIVLQAWLTALPKQEDDTEKIDAEKLPPTRDDLYGRVLEAEFGRWREEARDSGLTIISKVHHRRAAVVLTMLAPAPDAEAVDEVLSRLPEWSNEHLLRSRYAELLEETLLRGAGDGGVALQPDPVAEHLVLQVCGKVPELLDEVLPQDPLTVPGLEDPEADDSVVARALALGEQAERCCAVITRAADLNQDQALSLARRALAVRSHLWHVALRVSLARGGPFVRALEELVTSGADLPLAEIHEAIPLGHSWLRDLGVAVAQRLETLAGDEPAQRAQALNNLAVRLSEVGRRSEALEAAQEVVSFYRDLAEVNAAAYTPDLAGSLSNLAAFLSEAGRRDEALQAAQEAVDLRRDLAEINAAAYTPNLAGSLSNLAAFLSEAGRWDEALETAQEAVDLRRDLAEVNAAAYTPDLAGSLSNLASCLSEVGRWDEALRAAQQAVGLYQKLAEVNAAAYTPDLATSLNNLVGCLSEAGRRDEALQGAQEAVDLRRDLVETSPVVYIPYLVRSLTKLAGILSEVGRCNEALKVFIANTEHLSSAVRAYLLLTRARWRGFEGAGDVMAAAQEANKEDDPRFLGPCRREIAAALREFGLTNETLPDWATVIVDESLRQRLEAWLNCDGPAERATYLESEWSSPTSSDCETLDALTDLFVDVPPISTLHQYVTQIKSHGIDEIASLLRNQGFAINLTKEWLSEHRQGHGDRYLRNHPTLLTDPRIAGLVPQALTNLTSADEAAALTALLDLARLSDPEIAYAVTNADDADYALADLLGQGKWRAILAALVLNPSLADQVPLGILTEILSTAAAGETEKAVARLRGALESVSSFHIEQFRLLLSQALLQKDCPSNFSDLLDVLN